MGKKVNLSSHRSPVTRKKLKKDLILTVAIGLVWVLMLMLPWLIWLRPYKEFYFYESDAIYGQNIFVVGTHEEKIIYFIDGIKYEKLIKYSRTYYVQNTTKIKFYYQLDNPYYTINMRDKLLIVFPSIASAGLILSTWGIWNYKRETQKINMQNFDEETNEKFKKKDK